MITNRDPKSPMLLPWGRHRRIFNSSNIIHFDVVLDIPSWTTWAIWDRLEQTIHLHLVSYFIPQLRRVFHSDKGTCNYTFMSPHEAKHERWWLG